MSSRFSSALAQLDRGLQIIETQLGRLQAGLEVDEDQLRQHLTEVCDDAASLEDLIRAERADADWADRRGLDQLIEELETAARAKRRQERRMRLLELADELEAGRVKHRSAARTAALDRLRLDAVQELRTQAAGAEQEKDLPGPNAGEWMHWACNLQDQRDALALQQLHRDFGALERFTAEIEQSYWVSGQGEASDHPARAEGAKTRQAVESATDEAADATSKQPPVSASADTSWHAETASFWQRPNGGKAMDGSEIQAVAAPRLKYNGRNGGRQPEASAVEEPDLPVTGAVSDTTDHDQDLKAGEAPQPAEPVLVNDEAPLTEPEPSQTAVVASPAEAEYGEPDAGRAEEVPSFGELNVSNDRHVARWVAVASVVVLLAIVAGMHYFQGKGRSKAGGTTANAGTVADSVQDPDIQVAHAAVNPEGATVPEAASGVGTRPSRPQRQPVEGVQQKLLLSLELCQRLKSGSIECSGYASNTGSESSHVSLDRADVIDGKGNSFSVNSNGQFDFSTGRSFNIPAGSSARYTVKVPDGDREARTLTLYLDVRNPSGLEYTFRDVPIAD